jgi:hypothetical protein
MASRVSGEASKIRSIRSWAVFKFARSLYLFGIMVVFNGYALPTSRIRIRRQKRDSVASFFIHPPIANRNK